MEISFMRELENKIMHECSICNEYKVLSYLIMDEKGYMLNVCEECRDKLLIVRKLHEVNRR